MQRSAKGRHAAFAGDFCLNKEGGVSYEKALHFTLYAGIADQQRLADSSGLFLRSQKIFFYRRELFE